MEKTKTHGFIFGMSDVYDILKNYVQFFHLSRNGRSVSGVRDKKKPSYKIEIRYVYKHQIAREQSRALESIKMTMPDK